MINKQEVFQILEPYKENIKGVYLFGSYARGEQTKESDIDILVEIKKEFKFKEPKGYNFLFFPGYNGENVDYFFYSIFKEAISLNGYPKLLMPKLNMDLTLKDIEFEKRTPKFCKEQINIEKEFPEDEDFNFIISYMMWRFRVLFSIRCALSNQKYSINNMIEYASKNNISSNLFKKYYKHYKKRRENHNFKSNFSLNDGKKFYNLFKELLKDVNQIVKKKI